MARSDRRISVNEVTDGFPDPGDNTTLAPRHVGDERRLTIRRISDTLVGLSVSMKANAEWIKSFLHPGGAAKR